MTEKFHKNRRRLNLFFKLLFVSLIFSQIFVVNAQNSMPRMEGKAQGSYNLSEFENINLFNGKMNFNMPLVKLSGRGETGVSVNYRLVHKWDIVGDRNIGYQMFPQGNAHIDAGFINIEQETSQFNWYETNPTSCGTVEYQPAEATFSFKITSSDGSSHLLRSGNGAPISVPYCNVTQAGTNLGREFFSWEGDAVKFVADYPIFFNGTDATMRTAHNQLPMPISGYLFYPNGTRARIENNTASWIEDRNGNRTTFSISYETTGNTTTVSFKVTDSLGREVKLSYEENPTYGGAHTKIVYKGTGGQERIIRASNNHIWLPDGRKYNLYYNDYQELIKVETPSGAKFEYVYSGDEVPGPLPPGSSRPSPPYRRVAERKVYNGNTLEQKTLFSVVTVPATNSVTQVDTQDGSGNLLTRTKHYFHGDPIPTMPPSEYTTGAALELEQKRWNEGREYSTETFAQNGSTLLRKRDVVWEHNGSMSWWSGADININPRVASETITLSDASLVSKTEYFYASDSRYNVVTDTYDYDYGANAPGNFLRRSHKEFISYNQPSNNLYLLYLPSETWVSSDSAGNNKVSRVNYEYDNYISDSNHAPLVNRTNVVGHDSNFSTSHTSRGNVTKITSYSNAQAQTGAVSSYRQYDILGNPVKGIDAKGYVNTLDYTDRFGTPDAEARANTTPAQITGLQTFAFATSSTNATSPTNPGGYTKYTQFDYFTGAVVDAEDINGNVSSTISNNDPLDRTTQVIAANNRSQFRRQTTFYYDDVNRKNTSTTDSKTFGDNLIKSESFYDKLGRTTETREYENSTNYVVSFQEYDALGRAYKTTNPYRPYLNEQPQWSETAYDTLGRVKEIKTPDNAKVIRGYYGNVSSVVDQASRSRAAITDAIGRMTKVVEYEGGQAWESNYTYDVLGRLRKTSQIDQNQVEQNRYFLYDDLGRLLRAKQTEQVANTNLPAMTDPVTGNSGWSTAYSYDNNGNVISTTDANNKTIAGTYDHLNRLTLRDYSDSTPDVTFTYNDSIANAKGLLTSVSSTVSTTNYTSFDQLGRIKSSQQITNGQTYNFPDYSYDLSGTLVAQTYSSGRVVATETDTLGRLNKVLSQASGHAQRTYISNFSYTSFGAVQQARLGNGVWESAQFDNKRLQIKQIGLGASSGDTSYLKLEYDYGTTDNNGSLRQQKISYAGQSAQIIQNYTYDMLNRLKSATETLNGSSTPTWKQTFLYDRFGNRRFDAGNTTTLPANNGANNPNISSADNKFLVAEGYNYDNEGNLTSNPESQLFAYDAENRQIQVQNTATQTSAQYYYDGNGRRVKKVIGNQETIFVYDAFGKLTAELTLNQTITTEGTKYMTSDALGSPRAITGITGKVASRHDYMPFGEEVASGVGGRTQAQGYLLNNDGVRQQFTGYERDAESGLDYAQNRYFSSRHGRFTSVDPLAASASIKSPQTFNRYTYGLNSPYKFTDPLGLAPVQHCFNGICNTYDADEQEYRSRSYTLYAEGFDLEEHSGRCAAEFASCFQDEEYSKISKQHWTVEITEKIPIGRQYRGLKGDIFNQYKEVLIETIHYPDEFDNILWEFAQLEEASGYSDEIKYANWFSNERIGVTTSELDLGKPPATTLGNNDGNYKDRLNAEIDKASNLTAQQKKTLKSFTDEIMTRTANSSRDVGQQRARATNRIVKDAMKFPNYRPRGIRANEKVF